LFTVMPTATASAMLSMSDQPIRRRPKKMNDHRPLSMSWMANHRSADRRAVPG
jgi:hypothetical protein